MNRHLHCLGTAGYHPNETRHTSCYFIPETGLVLDAGTGMFRLPPLIQTEHLDILLSHAHLDHVAGLTFLLDVLYQRPVDQIRIWGEAEKLAAVREHLFASLIFPVEPDVQWCEIDRQESLTVNQCEVTWMPQEHPGGSVGYRLDWIDGEAWLYLTDTSGDESDEAIDFYRGAQLMLHECYFRSEHESFAKKTGHTWTDRLVAIAKASKPERLLLTHVNPLDESPERMLGEVEAGLRTEPISIELAADGMVITPDSIAE